MTKQKLWLLLIALIGIITTTKAQSLPGDSIVFGPMFSPVYHDSVRVWVLTKTNTGSGDALSLEVTAGNAPGSPLQGVVHNTDDRLGYRLRSFVYANLMSAQTYTAVVKKNGVAVRTAIVKNETNVIDDFEFLAGGCGRIYDTTRCIDRPESQTHVNGDPAIYNRMATEGSDLMLWLGDATYLLGLQHANGQCPNGVDDWANKDMAFARYIFYRKFHDSLTRAMPQLAITDNHDTGPNEFDKTMPTLGAMKEIFMDWWPNPEYKSTPEGQGLFSSYKYKDVEFFLLDNRSYRDGIQQQLGPEQLEWLKQGLLKSTASFKVLISGTPVFAKHWGGRNFSVTAQADNLMQFIKANNIDGVLAFSADIHEQEFYGRYADGKYPFFDIISGNLNSDIGNGQFSVNYNNDRILRGVKQTYVRVNVYGNAGDRRMKIAYVGLNGQSYFETIIHADMLNSVDDRTKKISLQFTGSLKDSSAYDLAVKTGSVTYDNDRKGNTQSAARFNTGTALQYPGVDLNDRAFSIGYWANPAQFLTGGNVVLSNATANTGVSLGFNKDGYPQYTDHKTNTTYIASRNVVVNKWTYIVWKYDNIKQQLSLFYNGWPIQSWSNVAAPASSSADLIIGSDFNNNHYVGLLDEVVVFGKLISDSRILENSGYTSHRGNVLKVAGSSGMFIPGTRINTALAGNFTIEFWGKLNADPGTNFKILASNGRVNNNTAGISFEFPDNNKMNIVLGTNTANWNTIADKGNAWKIGEWNHVAVSATKNGTLIYYVNGEKIGETAFTSYAANTFGLALGYSTYYGGSGVQAEMDELRIWNVALSQDSIRKRMHYSLTGAESGLQYYYDFEKHTDTSIVSKGAQPYELTLKGGELVSATSPVAGIANEYQTKVTGNWSRGNTANSGFSYPDAITVYNSNIVMGKNTDSTLATIPGNNIYYLKGGWQIDPLNNSFATIKITLTDALVKADSISKVAGKYYLLQQTAVADSLVIASQGNFDGRNITFLNVFLEEGIYHLGWQADTTGVISRTATFKVNAGSDDAEQDITAGTMNLTSSDLEFTKDGTSDQLLGIRFTGVNIPQGAIITNAYMQFTVDEVNTTGNVNMLIGVENTDNPLTMATFDFDIYHRIMNYGDTLIWKPGPFAVVGDAGTDQRTPDVSKLLQTIVNRPNWKSGNSVLFTLIDPAAAKIPGYTANTDKRVAQAYENNAANAAKLVVTYIVPNRYQNGTFPIAKKASWKYNDSGNDLSNTNWTAINYNDSSWTFGNGILGYGDGNETTTLNFGSDANNKRITYYLRNTFTVDDYTKYDSLLFDVLRDDGAIVYVNGTEAFRMNMPAGNVTNSTLASAAVNNADETTYFRAKTANLLKNGLNVIAVELHQNAVNSSDLSFDLEVGFTAPPLKSATYPLTKGSYWHYLDNGSNLDTVAWKDTTYSDRDWATGQGPLGYGDPMTTTISYGPDANNKYVTSYFRRDMTIDLAALPDSVEIGVRRDDGFIFYVNGIDVIRDNMPAGAITYQTFSANTIDGAAESIYYLFKLPKTIFRQGRNQLAVEVHNRSANSSDLGFDCYIKDASILNPPVVCTGKHIACFTSIVPTAQTTKMIIPEEHRFQLIFKQGDAYTKAGAGTVPGNHDFTAYVPDNGSSVLGRLSVNHENSPGGVSMLKIHYNDTTKLWKVDSSQPVDLYNNNLVTTMRNCSGGITPWGTVITSEESLNGGDANGDGYEDVGWNVEIDPVTAKVLDYNNDGKQDKLWAMGRMNHENVVVLADRKTVYYGEDGGTHCVYKFVADVPGNLSAGKVYVLSLDQPLVNDDPSGSTARWIQLPNTTQNDRNNMSSIAASLGGTNFNGVEDCEISPLDGKIYFTAKGKNRVYRFTDKGTTVENFETFVGGMAYQIYTKQGVYTEAWGDGNDNLTFDDKGNLWVLQDGGNYYIWVVRPDHTQSNPKVELFGSMPAGSEPTGLTFSPDYRFGFVSVQHPNGNNVAQQDATLNNVTFNASATIVIALNENLGVQKPVAGFKADSTVVTVGNKVVFTDTSKNYPTARTWTFEGGTPATSTKATETVTYNKAGKYKVQLIVSNIAGADTVVKTQYITVNNVTAVPDVELAKELKIYPNPTNGWIRIEFSLPVGKQVTLELYDAIGKKLTNLDKLVSTGTVQQLDYNIRPFVKSSQVFTIVLKTESGIVSRRLLFLNK